MMTSNAWVAGAVRRALAMLTIVSAAMQAPARADAQTRVDTMFTMSDGVRLSASYYIPSSPRPAGGHPALVLVHGFGGSKRDAPGAFAPIYADSGYFCLAYSVRGQGLADPATTSGGTFDWFTGERELADCRALVDWLRSRADVAAERIGIEGISQGALTAWGAAASGAGVRCIVPIIAVPRYSTSLAFNGCNSWATTLLLYTARTLNRVRFGPSLDSLWGLLQNDRHADLVPFLQRRNLDERIAELSMPVYVQMSWHDELFSPRDAVRAFNSLQGPRKLMLYPGGHSLPPDSLTSAVRASQTLRFYRRWLKDDTAETIMAEDSAVALVDHGAGSIRWMRTSDLPRFIAPEAPATRSNLRLYFASGERLLPAPPTQTQRLELTGTYVQDVSNEQYSFRSDPLERPAIVGGARVRLALRSNAARYQANVLLYDYDPATNETTPICRGAYEVRVQPGDPPGTRVAEYDLAPQCFTVARGHQIVATVKYGMPGGALALQKPAGEFGQSAYAPAATATTTLYSTPAGEADFGPSSVTVFLAGEPDARIPRGDVAGNADLVIAGTPARRGVDVRVMIPDGDSELLVEVFDSRGELVLLRNVRGGAFGLPTASLAAGAYTVRCTASGAIYQGRFVVQ